MSRSRPYHGVYHESNYDDGDEPLFFLDKGKLSRKRNRFGVWTMDLLVDEDGDDWDYGKRVPHVLYACPYCGAINATHVSRLALMDEHPCSLLCFECGRHLWIKFQGYEEGDWKRCLKKEKKS